MPASGASGWYQAGLHTPAGKLLAVDDGTGYGFGRRPEYFRWSTPLEYHLFSSAFSPEIIPMSANQPSAAQRRRDKCEVPLTKLDYHWSTGAPFHVRALALAGRTLFVAGPPDMLDEERAFDYPDEAGIQAKLEEQAASLEGKSGSILWAVSTADGRKLGESRLESLPSWDGMAAANGRLYLSMADGHVVCMAGK